MNAPKALTVSCVSPDLIDDFWPYVSPLLEKALERGGGMTLKELYTRLHDKSLLWLATSDGNLLAACVTELWHAYNGLTCVIVAVGGKEIDWAQTVHVIEEWAESEGCKSVRIYGRPGWTKVLPDYAPKWRIYEKEL